MPFAIIAGTGIYDIPNLELEPLSVDTPYGSAQLARGTGDNADIIFLTRHGASHNIPPHKINYRANIKALEQLGVKRVIANYAVGSINLAIAPQQVAVISDVLDFTSAREHSFFDGVTQPVKHVEMSVPYCPNMSAALLAGAAKFGLTLHPDAVYVATNGPRFETPVEIRMYGILGGDVVGMTGMPEVSLARELGMCFAGLALPINWAAGIKPAITIEEAGLTDLRLKLLQLCISVLRGGTDADCQAATLL